MNKTLLITIILLIIPTIHAEVTTIQHPNAIKILTGVTSMCDLADVNCTTNDDTYILEYDNTTSQWQSIARGGDIADGQGINDTNGSYISSATENGTEWIWFDHLTFVEEWINNVTAGSGEADQGINATNNTYLGTNVEDATTYVWLNESALDDQIQALRANDTDTWPPAYNTFNQSLNDTDNVIFNSTKSTNYVASDGTLTMSLTESSNNLIMGVDVGGTNYFSIETTGTFLSLIANPGPANNYLMASLAETQGADTYINFYEGGTGHNRIWDSGSARYGGAEGYLCNVLFGNSPGVDCDTVATGADVVIEDSIWTGGNATFGNESFNITDNGSIQTNGIITAPNWQFTESQITDLTHTAGPLTQEEVEDFAGAMVTGNTETLITVTYEDGDGTIDFVVTPTLSSYTDDLTHTTDTTLSEGDVEGYVWKTNNTGSLITTGIINATNFSLDNGGHLTDNTTCTIIKSPADTGILEICD